MSTDKHSKLPWRVGRSPALGHPLLLTDAGYAIADEIHGVTLEAAEANAAHLVKCVNLHDDLVTRLQWALEKLDECGKQVEFTLGMCRSIRDCKELLTRARQ